jgi:phage shock protein E
LILDVRSSEEFGGDHIEGSINLSLPELSQRIGELVKDKNTVILCHCLSGVRSGSAVSRLKRMGYTAYNVGSLHRAKKLLMN